MTTYYDVTLNANIPQGSNILNQTCVVDFTYPDGSHSNPTYNGVVFSWPNPNTVRITSAVMNVEAGWVGANGGTLTINNGGPLVCQIAGFVRVP